MARAYNGYNVWPRFNLTHSPQWLVMGFLQHNITHHSVWLQNDQQLLEAFDIWSGEALPLTNTKPLGALLGLHEYRFPSNATHVALVGVAQLGAAGSVMRIATTTGGVVVGHNATFSELRHCRRGLSALDSQLGLVYAVAKAIAGSLRHWRLVTVRVAAPEVPDADPNEPPTLVADVELNGRR